MPSTILLWSYEPGPQQLYIQQQQGKQSRPHPLSSFLHTINYQRDDAPGGPRGGGPGIAGGGPGGGRLYIGGAP